MDILLRETYREGKGERERERGRAGKSRKQHPDLARVKAMPRLHSSLVQMKGCNARDDR